MGFRITEVVRNLLIINVLFYFGTLMLMGEPALWEMNEGIYKRLMFAMHNPFLEGSGFQSFQIVTHMFMHSGADISHVFFNMFTLFMFGPILENKFGAKKFLFFYLASGIGALALYVGIAQFMSPGDPYILLGASGAVYGVLVAFMFYYPNVKLMLLIPPIPMKAKYLIGGLLAIDIFMGVLGSSYIASNTAHFAHIGGALTGFLIVWYWRRTGEIH